MSLTNTDTLTAGFPLVIPTQSQQPTARLAVRNKRGQVVQQWLVKQNKCTLGSASSCSLRCELEGVAPYHALLVIGARQIFIRALAPKLTRDGRAFNEILLTDEESHFEIAGHRFELSRSDATIRTASESDRAKPDRLKFTLARPFELSSRKASAHIQLTEPLVQGQDNPSNMANSDSKWVAQLIQAAVQPLECQLHNLIEPLTELQSESRRKRRLSRKRQANKRNRASIQAADNSPTVAAVITQVPSQLEELVVKQSAAMETLQERISDVNFQLSTIERIVAEERDKANIAQPPAEVPHFAHQSSAIDKLQVGVETIAAALERLHSGQTQVLDEDISWKSNVQTKLLGLTQLVESLSTNLSAIHQTVVNRAGLQRPMVNPVEDASWKSEVSDQLAGISQVVTQLTASVAAVQETSVRQAELEHPASPSSDDQHWKENLQQQLQGLTQVVDSLSVSVLESTRLANQERSFDQPFTNNGFDGQTSGAYWTQANPVVDEFENRSSSQTGWAGSTTEETFKQESQAGFAEDKRAAAEDEFNFTNEPIENSAAEQYQLLPDPQPAYAEVSPTLMDQPTEYQQQEDWSAGPQAVIFEQEPAAEQEPEFQHSAYAQEFESEANFASFEATQAGLEDPVEMIDELPTQAVADSREESDSDESPSAKPAVELPSWWRDDEQEKASPESKLDASLAGHGVRLPEKDEEEYSFNEPVRPPFTPVLDRKDESEEFFGLAQLELQEENSLNDAVAVPTLLPTATAEAVEEERNTEADELIGFGIEAGNENSADDDVLDSNQPAESEELELESSYEEQPANVSEPPPPVVLSSSSEDDSVEDYMRKLLARMRGVPEEEVEIAKPASSEAAAARPTEPAHAISKATESYQPQTSAGPRTTIRAPKTDVDQVGSTEPFDPEKYVPRALAPERTTSLAAMRELANSSARTAIHKSTRQRHVTSIFLKAIIAAVGLVVGLVLVAINGLNFNIGLIATLAAFLVATIWGYDSLTSIRPMLQAGLVLEPRTNDRKPKKADD